VYSVYKPPSTAAEAFYADLVDIGTADKCAGTTCVIAGDTNMNVLEAKMAQFVADRCDEMDMTQLVTEVTHRETCIDHAMVSNGRRVSNLSLLHPIEKHHTPVYFDVHIPHTRPSPPDTGITRQWRKANWLEMEAWLGAQEIEKAMAAATTIDECSDILTRYCNEALKLFVPQKPARRPKQQWVRRATVRELKGGTICTTNARKPTRELRTRNSSRRHRLNAGSCSRSTNTIGCSRRSAIWLN
jgi:hypothetical protein